MGTFLGFSKDCLRLCKSYILVFRRTSSVSEGFFVRPEIALNKLGNV